MTKGVSYFICMSSLMISLMFTIQLAISETTVIGHQPITKQLSNNFENIDIFFPINEIVLDNTTVWEDKTINLAESVVITNGGNLTIINSHVNFTASESGFILENSSVLFIQDSIIEFGAEAVSGGTNGSLTLNNATFSNFSDDVISLEGDYLISIDLSIFQNNLKDVLDIEDISNRVNITNCIFNDNEKDGIKTNDVSIFIDGCQFLNQLDEGIQAEGDGTLTVKNSQFIGCAGDAIAIEEHEGVANIEKVTIQDGYNDGIDLTLSETDITIKDTIVENNDGNGLEVEDWLGFLRIEDSLFNDNANSGMEISNATEVTILRNEIVGNTEYGIYISIVPVFLIEYSNITDNSLEGILAIDIQNADAHMNRFMNNGNFALNATAIGTGRTFNATHNYWGTLNASNLPIVGSVETNPILDFNLQIVTTPATTPATTPTDTEPTSPTPLSILAIVITSLMIVNILIRRKQKE